MKLRTLLKNHFIGDDLVIDSITVHSKEIEYSYLESLVDIKSINRYVLTVLDQYSIKQLKHIEQYLPDCHIQSIKEEMIDEYLGNGFLILNCYSLLAIEFRSNLSRGVPTISSELSLSGPKDSFSEVFQINLGLIRRRIKSSNLCCDSFVLGRYTKTKVSILSIKGIVKPDLVQHVKENLLKIDIDGVIDSSYLRYSLENKFHLFPTIMMSERPDKCSMALLEGKVVVLVDNSPYALILPSFFFDYFHTADDYYQKSFNASFIRMIRFMAFLIALYVPGGYLSVTTRDYSLIPLNLLLVLKAGRSFVPFPAYLEALFMIICFEILKESDLRMSTTSGSAISILGGLILGDAAVAAGIVSPIMIIIIAISSISGLIFTSVELGNALRTYKILFLILATLFGVYGIIYGTFILIYDLCSTEIFGYSYLSFNFHDIKDSIIKIDSVIPKRNSKLSNNIIRGRYHK